MSLTSESVPKMSKCLLIPKTSCEFAIILESPVCTGVYKNRSVCVPVSDSVYVRVISLGCSWCNLSFCGTDAPVNSLQLPCNMGDICGCCEANNLINQFMAVQTLPLSFTHKQHALAKDSKPAPAKDSKRQMSKQLLDSLSKESSFLLLSTSQRLYSWDGAVAIWNNSCND